MRYLVLLLTYVVFSSNSSDVTWPDWIKDVLKFRKSGEDFPWEILSDNQITERLDSLISLHAVNYLPIEEYQAAASKQSKLALAPGKIGTFLKSELQLPREFNLWDKYSNLKTMNLVSDQLSCGSCWAHATAYFLTERYAVFLDFWDVENIDFVFSAAYLNQCVYQPTKWCRGGLFEDAIAFAIVRGVVSESCLPYKMPPGRRFIPMLCPTKCVNKERITKKHKVYVKDGGIVPPILVEEHELMAEIMENGSVGVSMRIYSDFFVYKGGVYEHKAGTLMGLHAIRIIGWGETENGNKYWICVNSWGKKFGMDGIFYIKKGVNECGIESHVALAFFR